MESNNYESKFPEEFFKQIEEEFGDLRNPHVEQKFSKDHAFQVEFKFEPNERLLYFQYQKVKYAIFKTLLGCIMIFFIFSFPFILMDLLIPSINKYLNIAIIIIIVVICFIAILSIIFVTISATSYRYIITDRRIIIGYTLGQRWSRSVNFTNILDIIVRQGPIARLFGVGSINIITGSNEGFIPVNASATGNVRNVIFLSGFINVPKPFKIKKLICKIRNYYEVNKFFKAPLNVPELKNPKLKFEKYYDLAPDEKIYKVYSRKRMSSYCGLLSFVYVVIMIIFQLSDLTDLFINNIQSSISLIVGFILFFTCVIFLLIPVSKYHSKGFEYLVTDRRIIMFKKFINIRLRDAIMGKITEVSLGQQIVGRVADFGTIKIGTKGFESRKIASYLLSINGVPNSPKEKDEILNIITYYQDGKLYSPIEELYNPEYFSRT